MINQIKPYFKSLFSLPHIQKKQTQLGLFFLFFSFFVFQSYFVEIFIAKILDISSNLLSQTSTFSQFIVVIFQKVQNFFLFLGLFLVLVPLKKRLIQFFEILIGSSILLILFILVDRSIVSELIYGKETKLDDISFRIYLLFIYVFGTISAYFLLTVKKKRIRYFFLILSILFATSILTYRDFGWNFSIDLIEAILSDIQISQKYNFTLIALTLSKYLVLCIFCAILWEFFIFYFKIKNSKWSLAFPVCLFLVSLYFSVFLKGKVTGFHFIFKIPISFISYFVIEEPIEKQAEIFFPKKSKPKVKNIVLILDETISGDFFQINGYFQDTTPFLSKNPHLYSNFGIAYSASSNTLTTNRILQSGADISDLPYPKYSRPSIFQYAKKAGFEVSFLDGQYRHTSVVNSLLSPEDKIYHIDKYFSILDTFGSNDYLADRKLIDEVEKTLKNGQNNFIYVMKSGMHFPFEGFYPEKNRVFKPVLDWKNITVDYKRTLNSYQNGILWSSDSFCKYMVEKLAQFDDTLVIYTADHGIRVMNRFSDKGENLDMLAFRVPMLLFPFQTSEELQKKIKQAAKLNWNQTSHFSLFPSILYFLGYPSKQIRQKYQKSLFGKNTKDKQKSILIGGIHGKGNLELIEVKKPVFK